MNSKAIIAVCGFACIAVVAGLLPSSSARLRGMDLVVPVRAQQPTPPAQAQIEMPSAEKIVLLVRNTLITLNNALRSGNYTVLRDLAAPAFRESNTAADLSHAFSDLGKRDFDLAVVTVMTPKLSEAPGLDKTKGTLRLKGYFPSNPVRLDFDLTYQAVDRQWRLSGLWVQLNNRNSIPAGRQP